MPIVIAEQVMRKYVEYNFAQSYDHSIGSYLFLVPMEEISEKYGHFCIEGTTVNGYLSRIFNGELQVVMEPRLFVSLNLMNAIWPGTKDKLESGFYLDFDDLAKKLSIPNGYYVEVLLTSMRNRQYGEKIIFPHELRVSGYSGLLDKVNERMEALRKVGSLSESQSFLVEMGLSEIAKDLSDGYSRFEMGDYDGAIKAYRKVTEGLRNCLKERETEEGKTVFKRLIDNSEKRTEELIRFLNITYSLLSNFGEHYGTHAFDEEGIFAHKLVESLTEYLTKKLRHSKE
jgi:hypothetical protein